MFLNISETYFEKYVNYYAKDIKPIQYFENKYDIFCLLFLVQIEVDYCVIRKEETKLVCAISRSVFGRKTHIFSIGALKLS